MKKTWILVLLFIGGIFNLSAEKLNIKKKNHRSIDGIEIVESVHSNIPDAPQIKIRLADSDEEDVDADATISMDLDSEEDKDDDVPIRTRKLPKSKSDDIHTFL